MHRTEALTRQELADLSIELRRVREIGDYCNRVRLLLSETFGNRYTFCYHFADGQLHMPSDDPALPQWWLDLVSTVPVMTASSLWERFRHEVSHTGNFVLDPWLTEDHLAKVFASCEGWAEHQVTGMIFDDKVLIGAFALVQSMDHGPISEAVIQSMNLLHPHVRAGMLESAAYSRARRYGDGFAAAVEAHPSAVFLFDNEDSLVYANHRGRLLMQDAPHSGSRIAVADVSPLPAQLVAGYRGKAETPAEAIAARFIQLPDWPDAMLERPWMAVVDSDQVTPLPLTPREDRVLTTLLAQPELTLAAAELGISIDTLRTHQKTICRKLQVSGTAAALTLWWLQTTGRGTAARENSP